MLSGFEPTPVGERGPAFGVIAPHAGWRFSGEVAFKAYTAVEPFPARVLILCTAHRVASPEIALWPSDAGDWETPLGPVPIDVELTEHLLNSCPSFAASARPHMQEHAAELQLPFLLHRRPDVKVAIATVAMHPRTTPLERMLLAGSELAAALANFTESSREGCQTAVQTNDPQKLNVANTSAFDAADRRVLVVVSSDLSHEDDDATTRAQDIYALDAIQTANPRVLYDAVQSHNITMCGAGAAILLLQAAAQTRGGRHASNIAYRTSADATGSAAGYTVGYLAATL